MSLSPSLSISFCVYVYTFCDILYYIGTHMFYQYMKIHKSSWNRARIHTNTYTAFAVAATDIQYVKLKFERAPKKKKKKNLYKSKRASKQASKHASKWVSEWMEKTTTLQNDIETLSNVESFEMRFSLHLLLFSILFFVICSLLRGCCFSKGK